MVELVQRNTKPDELEAVKKWTDLWKNLLSEYYTSIGNNFKRLVEDLRKYECKRHEVTTDIQEVFFFLSRRNRF